MQRLVSNDLPTYRSSDDLPKRSSQSNGRSQVLFRSNGQTEWRFTSSLQWAVVTGAGLRILFYLIADNNGGDAIARAARIGQWMRHPTFAGPDPIWGAVYFYIAGTAGILFNNPELAGRLLSMICGIGSVFLVYRLADILAGEEAGVTSAWVCALSGLHIGYSTTSSSEVPYLFFLLAGLVGFFEYKASGRLWPLVWGGVCYSLAAGIRYEGWIFLPFLGLTLVWPLRDLISRRFWRSHRGVSIILFILLFGAWPCIWTAFSWAKWGDPLYAIHLNSTLVHQTAPESIRPQPYRLALPVGVLLLSLSPLPFAGALYAIGKYWKESLARQFITVASGFALVQYFQLCKGAVISNARYTLTLFILCTVLSGIGISEFLQPMIPLLARRSKGLILATLVFTQIAIWAGSESRVPFNEKLASISPRLRYSHYIEDAAKVLRPRLKSTNALIMDRYDWEDNIFAHALGLPLNPEDERFHIWHPEQGSLEKFVDTYHPRFLVYSDQGVIKTYLDLPQRCTMNEVIGDMRLNCFFSNSIYRVYEIQYFSK